MTWQQFKNRFNVPCIQFEYNALLRSLPTHFKCEQVNCLYEQPGMPARIQYLMNNTTYTKYFARALVRESQDDVIRLENKWTSDIGSFEHLSVLFVHKSIGATRYTSFQFKLVMRILTTNTFLSIIHLKDSNKCTFCDHAPETIKHLFLACQFVRIYWEDISLFLSENGLRPPNDTIKMFGDGNNDVMTHVVTVAKYVIYNARFRESRPSFIQRMAEKGLSFRKK